MSNDDQDANWMRDLNKAAMTALRVWTLGDIVTAAVQAGFVIERLQEHPDGVDPAILGTFLLVARRGGGLG